MAPLVSLGFPLDVCEDCDRFEGGTFPSCERVLGVCGGVAWFRDGELSPSVSFLTFPADLEADECLEAESGVMIGLGGVVEGRREAGFEICAAGTEDAVTTVGRGFATEYVCLRALDGGGSRMPFLSCAESARVEEAWLEPLTVFSSLLTLHMDEDDDVGGVGYEKEGMGYAEGSCCGAGLKRSWGSSGGDS